MLLLSSWAPRTQIIQADPARLLHGPSRTWLYMLTKGTSHYLTRHLMLFGFGERPLCRLCAAWKWTLQCVCARQNSSKASLSRGVVSFINTCSQTASLALVLQATGSQKKHWLAPRSHWMPTGTPFTLNADWHPVHIKCWLNNLLIIMDFNLRLFLTLHYQNFVY